MKKHCQETVLLSRAKEEKLFTALISELLNIFTLSYARDRQKKDTPGISKLFTCANTKPKISLEVLQLLATLLSGFSKGNKTLFSFKLIYVK